MRFRNKFGMTKSADFYVLRNFSKQIKIVMKRYIIFSLLILLIFFSTQIIYPQDSVEYLDDLYIDFSIPDNTAFKMLNIKDDEVSRPGNLKEFSFSYINLISGFSKINQGIAIEWAPLYTTTNSIKKYKELGVVRNLSLSFATASSTTIESSGTDIAFGLSIIPLDDSDPLLDDSLEDNVNNLLEMDSTSYCQNKIYYALQRIKNKYDGPNRKAYENLSQKLKISNYEKMEKLTIDSKKIVKEFEKELKEEGQPLDSDYLKDKAWLINYIENDFKEIVEIVRANFSDEVLSKLLNKKLNAFKKRKWNARVLQLSAGWVLTSNNSTWKKLTNDRFSGYAGYTDGISDWGQYIANLQYTWSAKGENNIKDKISGGMRLILGNSDKRFSAEFMYSSSKKKDIQGRENKLKGAIGCEFKISEGIWVELAFGVDNVLDDLKNSSIISLADFKYTFKKEPRYFGD